ncbi:unnamed protein product [Durusdinium trenchii]|uniref:TPM domain-containing protein n=1 Tax=Durusdinium trenchii TaxID=1381693 RepID=A0ABP0LJV7_9DINO
MTDGTAVRTPSMAVPASLRLLGRAGGLENSDICGYYVHSGWNEGHATYLQVGSHTALMFRRGCWVIDRQGVQDSEMAVAWAKDNGALAPTASTFGPWFIWSESAQDFLADANLIAIDAPDVTFISRRSDISGEYHFAGLSDGSPYYANGDMLIRYHSEGRKWLVAGTEHKGNNCIAFAEAQDTPHPGFAFLKWHVWNGATGQWNADANCHCLAAPSVIHVLGRHAQACNARICGSYHLAGLREGRPLYLLPGKKAVIRYASETDRWLIDFEALAELVSEPPSWVSDSGRFLEASEQRRLEELCEALANTNVEASVVVLAGLHPEVSSVSGFAAALMNFWGVGHPRLHTGLLVMLLVQQRCLEMRVGYGLARLLPTEKLQQIQQERAAERPERHLQGFYEQDDTAERMQCPNYLPVGVVRSESDKQPRECTRCSVLPWARQASHEEICRLDVSNCSVLKPGERCWIRCREPYFEGEPVHVMCNNSEESGGGLAWDRKTPKCKMKCPNLFGVRSSMALFLASVLVC